MDRSLLRIKEAGEVFLIGALKSVSAGAQGLEDARGLTNAMEGMRPKTVLLFVAQVLSRSLGLSGLFAVSNAGMSLQPITVCAAASPPTMTVSGRSPEGFGQTP